MICPLCRHHDTVDFFALPNVPVTCASVFATAPEAQNLPSGQINLTTCIHCGFVFNRSFDPSLGEIGAQYESSQAASAHFGGFAKSLAEDWVTRYNLAGASVIEVGCGSGDFLRQLVACGVGKAIGIDPLAPPTKKVATPNVEVMQLAFDAAQLHLAADALVCRHTLEHVQDVQAFLSLLRQWAEQSPQRVVLIEIPDAERVFAERAFWDIYYEHCSYFTEQTVRRAFELAGFEVLRASRVYGNQYLIVEARPRTQADAANASPMDPGLLFQYQQFASDVHTAMNCCQAAIEKLKLAGQPLILWQGAAKTVGFMAALPDHTAIDGAIDLSPHRQGKFLPGSGLPVYAPEELRYLRPRYVVLMNPVYLDEVRARIASLDLDVTVYPINDLLLPSFTSSADQKPHSTTK